MAFEKIKIFDPVTGKYKIVKATKENKRIREEQLKEKKLQRKKEQKSNKFAAAEKRLTELKKLNPKQYKNKKVSVKTGRIVNKETYYRHLKETANKRREQRIRNIINSNSIIVKSVRELNDLSKQFNHIIDSMREDIKEYVIASIGGTKVNEDNTVEDFYSYKYDEEMLPNVLEEVKTLKEKIQLAMNAVLDFAKYNVTYTNSDEDAEILSLCNGYFKALSSLVDAVDTADSYKRLSINYADKDTDLSEPIYNNGKNDLHKSGIIKNKR